MPLNNSTGDVKKVSAFGELYDLNQIYYLKDQYNKTDLNNTNFFNQHVWANIPNWKADFSAKEFVHKFMFRTNWNPSLHAFFKYFAEDILEKSKNTMGKYPLSRDGETILHLLARNRKLNLEAKTAFLNANIITPSAINIFQKDRFGKDFLTVLLEDIQKHEPSSLHYAKITRQQTFDFLKICMLDKKYAVSQNQSLSDEDRHEFLSWMQLNKTHYEKALESSINLTIINTLYMEELALEQTHILSQQNENSSKLKIKVL